MTNKTIDNKQCFRLQVARKMPKGKKSKSPCKH